MMKVEADRFDPVLCEMTSAPMSLYSDGRKSMGNVGPEEPPKTDGGEKQHQVDETIPEASVNQSHVDQASPDDIVKELLEVHREEAEERERALRAAEER